MDKLLTVREACAQLSLGRAKLYELMRVGAIRTVHIGRSVRIPQSVLEGFIVEKTKEPRKEAVMARHLTKAEIDDRIACAYNHGIEVAAKTYQVTTESIKSCVKRHGSLREQQEVLGKTFEPLKGNHYPTADEVMHALVNRAAVADDIMEQLKGAQAKIESLEGQLESAKAARERTEGMRQDSFRERTARFVGQAGD